jgi:spoIIIJ-associated protein
MEETKNNDTVADKVDGPVSENIEEKVKPESPPEQTPEVTQETAAETAPEPTAGPETPVETPPSEPEPITPEKIEADIQKTVDTIIGLIGIRAQVRSKILEEGEYYVNLRSRNSDGLLIGRRGMTILSIQAVVNQIMKHRYPGMPIDVFVDVSGYRKRHENFIKKKALAVAKIVVDTKRDMALDLLTEREFRMVENELAELGTVRVYSIGSGSRRTVIIAPL